MKYKAVIFDLGGTLVTQPSQSEILNNAREIASVISAPVEDFVELWFSQSSGLDTGFYQDYQEYIRYVSERLGLKIEGNLVDYAASIDFELTRRMVTTPRAGAMELLTYLKSNGYKIGLISDCGPDIPIIWDDTLFVPLFDVTIFSCSVGMNKGDTRIFELAMDELAVQPEDCLYIADGMRNELANAVKVGLDAVRIHVPDEIDDNPLRENWDGPVITSLEEVMGLVK